MKKGAIGFILGILLGRKGIPILWHIFYLSAIIIMLVLFKLEGLV